MRLLQLSDLHFGRNAIAAYTAAVARRIASKRYDAVVLVGDLTQRNFRAQFAEARAFIDAACSAWAQREPCPRAFDP